MKGIILKRAEWEKCQGNFFSFQLTGSMFFAKQENGCTKVEKNVSNLFRWLQEHFSFFRCFAAVAAAKSLQLCPILCNPIDGSPPGSPRPWDSPGRNTGVGCHFLLQRMEVKSESEVAQSCPTLSDPMDCSLPSSSVHGIF